MNFEPKVRALYPSAILLKGIRGWAIKAGLQWLAEGAATPKGAWRAAWNFAMKWEKENWR